MDKTPADVVERFATAFAGSSREHGMSADEVIAFFRRYSPTLRGKDTYDMVPLRRDLFEGSLAYLSPPDQWRALRDLAENPPNMKYGHPPKATLDELRAILFQGRSGVALGVLMSRLSAPDVQAAWFKALSRLETSPPAAVTAARTMLEETCKRIIVERGMPDPDAAKGDLAKLVKFACQALGSGKGVEREVISGLAGASTALAWISNEAGDRHGVLRTAELPVHDAEFAVASFGAIAVFLTRRHHATPRPSAGT